MQRKFSISITQLVFLAVIGAFTGTAFLSVSFGAFHVFPFRILLLLLWAIVLSKTDRVFNMGFIQTKSFLGFLIFWFLYSLISLVWSADKVSAIKQITFLFMNVSLVLFMTYYIREFRHVYFVYKIWLFIHLLLLPIAIWEIVTGNHLSNSGLLKVDEGYEFYKFAPTTVFGNQNDYATMIALVFPMLYVGVRYAEEMRIKFLLLLVIILSVLILFFASSRANYIGVAMGFAFWFFFLLRTLSRFNLLLIFLLLLLLIAISLSESQVVFLTAVWEDFNVLIDSQGDDAGIDIRSNLIKNGLYFLLITFGIGVGAGNIEYYMVHQPKYFVGDTANVHNWWIEILANYGIVVFLAYIIFFLGIFWNLFKIYRQSLSKNERIMCEAMLCALVSFPVSSLSSSSLMSFGPQWVFFGMAIVFINHRRRCLVKQSVSCIS